MSAATNPPSLLIREEAVAEADQHRRRGEETPTRQLRQIATVQPLRPRAARPSPAYLPLRNRAAPPVAVAAGTKAHLEAGDIRRSARQC
jgi:hypothetical protein